MLRRPAPILLTALAALALAAGCDKSLPSVDVRSMTVQKLALDSADYLVVCDVRNPNAWQMRVDEVTWQLFSQDSELLHGRVSRPHELPAGKAVPMNMALNVPREVLTQAGLGDRRRFPYRFEALATFNTPLGKMEVPFSNAGHMPVIQRLDVELTGVELIGTTQSKVGMNVGLRIRNDNAVHLIPWQLAGNLQVNQRPLVDLQADMESPRALAPGESSAFIVPVWVRSPEVGVRTLSEMIADPEADYRLIGDVLFRLPGSGDVNDLLADTTPAVASEDR